MFPKVSICCVTYNHVNYIKQTLDGFLIQETNFDFEIIIHDDASYDGTAEIIKEYHSRFPNIIKSFFQKENQWSKGVRGMFVRFTFPHAQGKYIALCEGDDYWTDPLKLQKQVDFLETNPNVAICFHRANILKNGVFELHQIPKEFENKEFNYIELLKHYNFITTASVVFRKPDSFEFPDWFFNLPFGDLGLYKLISDNKYLYALPDVMSVYRIHDGGMWSSLGLIKEQNVYLSFYEKIYKALNIDEKQIVKEKIKATKNKIAKFKFPKNRLLMKVYLQYLHLKKQ